MYKAVGFNSLDQLNQYFTDNVDDVPVTMCQGWVQNSGVVVFETPDHPGPPPRISEYTVEEEVVAPPEVWDEEKR